MKCKCCNRDVDKLTMGYCIKHYDQYNRYGKCLDSNPRTKYDLNEIVILDTHAEVILYNSYNEEIDRCLIDSEDVDKVKDIKWHISKGYCRSNEVGSLHRFIMNPNDDEVIDHKSRNRLDNRRLNLRECNNQENQMNKSIQSNNTSGIVGVSWRKDRNKWRAYITLNNKQITLGMFKNLEDAIEVRKNAEIKYFGDFAPQS